MGSQESKIEQSTKQEEEHEEISEKGSIHNTSALSTPILTPLDPRSPSVNIARTPLEVILGANTIKETEEFHNAVDEDKDTVNVVLGIDPRSPTVEFNRTPIIVGTVAKDKPLKLQNKNLAKILKTELQTTPVAPTKRPSKIISPKLLSTSPASVAPNYNKRKSFVGLLETNLDFTETDLDVAQKAKNHLNASLPLETESEDKDELNASLPVAIDEDLPCNKLEDQMKALGLSTEDKLSPEVTPEPEVLLGNEKLSYLTSELEKELGNEEKVINVTAQVKDFDKKLTNLIYQDGSEDEGKLNLRPGKVKENNRTPLSVRNSNEDNKKGQRLRVSDKPRKTEFSKIPVFKDSHHIRRSGQCENTPPIRQDESRLQNKVSHWDADKTLII